MTKPTFITRMRDNTDRDYISEVNDTIRESGFIDPNSDAYLNAIEQYNAEILKGTVRRLEVPNGFCGFIDPSTGLFRVEENTLGADRRSSTLYPDDIVNPEDVPDLQVAPYPIDMCLSVGLPGSVEYANGKCGDESGDNDCSGIDWFPNVEDMFGEGAEGEGGVATPGSGGWWGELFGISNTGGNIRTNAEFYMKNVVISGGTITWTGGPTNWPVRGTTCGEIHLYRRINGNWLGGKFEHIRNNQFSRGLGNIIAGYNGHTVPEKGEELRVMVVSYDGNRRSNWEKAFWNGEGVSESGTGMPSMDTTGDPPPAVCKGGPGINSNTGLASAGSAEGLTSMVPKSVRDLADGLALSLWTTAGFTRGVGTPNGEGQTNFTVYYNVRDPDEGKNGVHRPEGLRVFVIYNKETDSAKFASTPWRKNF